MKVQPNSDRCRKPFWLAESQLAGRAVNRGARRRFASARQSSLPTARRAKTGGAEGIRTPDPHNAIVVLYQLSYDPIQGDGNLKTARELSKPILTRAIRIVHDGDLHFAIPEFCGRGVLMGTIRMT